MSAIENLHVRTSGMTYHVTVHVQTDGAMPLDAAHALGGRVKSAICANSPQVSYVLVHMERYDGGTLLSRSSSGLSSSTDGA